jgi:hypothetical protein
MTKPPMDGGSAEVKGDVDGAVVDLPYLDTTAPETAQASTQRKTPTDRVVADLGPNWRVISDDLQSHLQHRKGGSWRTRSWCRTKLGLTGCIREHIGIAAVEVIDRFPEYHPDALKAEISDLEAEAEGYLEAKYGDEP